MIPRQKWFYIGFSAFSRENEGIKPAAVNSSFSKPSLVYAMSIIISVSPFNLLSVCSTDC
eukprot:m.33707 g.33707  ORF g.33707 m.33707 type:complete len:60 (-) comp9656_c0_seq1:176-355(-)